MNPPKPSLTAMIRDSVALLAFLAVCFAAAGLGAWLTSSGVEDWYPTLRKPTWTPPARVFAPVWTVLYLSMGVAAWLVWRRADGPERRTALVLFATQLVLNIAWSGLFFGLRRPGLAFGEIIVVWAAIAATLWAFSRVSPWAAGLFVPYLLWVAFAAALNGTIWWMNSGSLV